jgi:plasmid stability protein
MAQLVVRNVEDAVAERLRKRAARRGVSAEEEHRRILREAVSPRADFKALLSAIPAVGRDEDFERAPQEPREVEL